MRDEKSKMAFKMAARNIFFVFDLGFDLDLSIETTFKGIIKKFTHIEQNLISLI